MPFRSQAQARYMFAKMPKVAKEFASKTPSIKALPEHVKHKMEHSIHKHTSAHDQMSVGAMHEHHAHKMHPAHSGHPMYKHYKAGVSGVRHVDTKGTVVHKKMSTASDHGA